MSDDRGGDGGDDAGRMHRRGRGPGRRFEGDGDLGSDRRAIPGKATLTERLPPAHPAAVAQRRVRAAAGAAAQIEAMTAPLAAAIAAVDYGESAQLAFEIRMGHRRAERELAQLADSEHGEPWKDAAAAVSARLAGAMREASLLLRAAPRLDAPGAGSEAAERAWRAALDGRSTVETMGAAWQAEVAALAPRLGLDAVEVRSDDHARAVTDAHGARGVALDNVIHLHPERVQPGTAEGREVLAHELVHLAQARLPVAAASPRDDAEHEAADLAGSLARGAAVQPRHRIDLSRAAADVHAPPTRAGALDAQHGTTYLRLRLHEIVDRAVTTIPYDPGSVDGVVLDGPAFAHYLQARVRAYVDRRGVAGLCALARPLDLEVVVASLVLPSRHDVMNAELLARVSTVIGSQLVVAIATAFARVAPRVVIAARAAGDAAWLTREDIAADGHVDALVVDALLRPAITKIEVAATERARADARRAAETARVEAMSATAAATLLDASAARVRAAGEAVGPWHEAIGESVRSWLDHQRYWIMGVSDAKLATLAPVIEAGARTIASATEGIRALVARYPAPQGGPDGAEVAPIRAVLARYCRAIDAAHEPDAGHADLVTAQRAASMIELDLVSVELRESRDAVAGVAAAARVAGVRTSRLANAPAEAADARATEHGLETALRAERQRVVAGGEVDPDAAAEIATAAAELAICNRLEALVLQSHTVLLVGSKVGAKAAVSEMTYFVAGPVHRIEVAYERGQAEIAAWRAAQPTLDRAEDRRRRQAMVADAKRALAAITADAKVEQAFVRAEQQVRDAQLRAALLDLAILVGIAIFTGQIAGAVGALVRGAAMAAEVTEGALIAQRTANLLGAVSSLVVDSALGTGAQRIVTGGSGGSVAGDLATNAAALLVLRPFAALARDVGAAEGAAQMQWIRRGGRWALQGTITGLEVVAATAVTYVSNRVQAAGGAATPEQEAVWLEQGLSIVLAKVLSTRLDAFELRIKELGEAAGRAVAQRLRSASRAAAAAADSGSTVSLLHAAEAYRSLLATEAELLTERATAGQPVDAAITAAHAAARTELGPEQLAFLRWRKAGLEPLSADGSLWLGSRQEIDHAIAAAGPDAAASVVHEPDGRVRLRVGGEDVVLAPRGAAGADHPGSAGPRFQLDADVQHHVQGAEPVVLGEVARLATPAPGQFSGLLRSYGRAVVDYLRFNPVRDLAELQNALKNQAKQVRTHVDNLYPSIPDVAGTNSPSPGWNVEVQNQGTEWDSTIRDPNGQQLAIGREWDPATGTLTMNTAFGAPKLEMVPTSPALIQANGRTPAMMYVNLQQMRAMGIPYGKGATSSPLKTVKMSTIQNFETVGHLKWLCERYPTATLDELIVHTASYRYAEDIITQAGYRVTGVHVDTSGGSIAVRRLLAHYETDATARHLFQQSGAERKVVHDKILDRYGIDADDIRAGGAADIDTNFNIYLEVEPSQ
jgi:hypothetical protein